MPHVPACTPRTGASSPRVQHPTSRRIRLTQLDGKLPNLALMKLAHWHRAQGDTVVFKRHAARDLFEEPYDIVYGSTLFTRSRPLVDRLRRDFPGAIVGGPGTLDYGETYDPATFATVERVLGLDRPYEHYDYGIYPDFSASIGRTSMGCRFSCPFCPVARMEGRVRATASLEQIWRGEPYPKHLQLLDNDIFGQPNWKAIVEAMIDGGYRVCVNQGINVRVITPLVASYIARMPYYDDSFTSRRLYTAWDNIDDDAAFERGISLLFAAGVPAHHVMVYMLVGFDPNETVDRIFYRFQKMAAMGVRVYPMPYNETRIKLFRDGSRIDLKALQRWVVTGAHKVVPWKDYRALSRSSQAIADEQIPLLGVSPPSERTG